jgi:hypothetical protein
LNTGRNSHTTTLLPNGKVLVAGGKNAGNYFSSAELYDPASGTWTPTGALGIPRDAHTATLLPNGKVLVAGGENATGVLPSAEVYDPASGTWSATGLLNTKRQNFTATLLLNGKVLAAGGFGGFPLSDAELYDPANGIWTATGSLIAGRINHTASLLPNGKVLVAAGENMDTTLPTAEVYDVGLGFSASWQPLITGFNSPLSSGASLVLTGSGFRGISEAASGNAQDSPADFPLVQIRSLESSQTIFLPSDPNTSWSATSFTSTALNALPLGYALVTVFVNGIPSTAGILDVTVPAPLMNVKKLTRGSVQLNFIAAPGLSFTVLASTDIKAPVITWTVLGLAAETTPGHYQFTTTTGSQQRFYRIRWP